MLCGPAVVPFANSQLSSTENSPSLARTGLLGSLNRGSSLRSGPSECDCALPDDRCRVRRCVDDECRKAHRHALRGGGERRCVDDRERRRQRPACRFRQSRVHMDGTIGSRVDFARTDRGSGQRRDLIHRQCELYSRGAQGRRRHQRTARRVDASRGVRHHDRTHAGRGRC